jgi:protein phosphatase
LTKPVRVSVFGKTDLGRSRDHNEDAFLVSDLSTKRTSLLPEVREHEVGPRGSFFMVADGMGGAAAGEVASAMATEMIHQHMLNAWGGDSQGFQDVVVNLPAGIGGSGVRMRWRMGTDNFAGGRGYALDDIHVGAPISDRIFSGDFECRSGLPCR